MKKTTLFLAVASVFSVSVFAADPVQKNQPIQAQPSAPGGVTIVRDLKDQDREVYESLKKGGGKSGVITSTVVVSDTGEESVIASSAKSAQKAQQKAAEPKVAEPKAKSATEAQAPSAKPSAKSAEPRKVTVSDDQGMQVVKSDAPILDALDGRMRQQKLTDDNPVGEQAEVAKPSPTYVRSGDYATPEAGSRVIERVNRKEVVERMIPPPDEMLYGAIRGAGKPGSGNSGASDAPIVLDAIQGVNEIVTIGKSDLNRFVTPFEKVKVRTMAGEDELVSKVDGNIVYLGATRRVGVFLTEIGSDRAISLTLVPDDIPPRDIYLKLSRAGNIPAQLSKVSRSAAKANGSFTPTSMDSDGPSGKSQSHVDVVKDVMREMALGKIPNGYTMMPPKMGEFRCNIPGFRMRLGQAIEGSNQKIMVFRAENTSTQREAAIDEQYCYKRGVIAVGAWPDVVVPPGGATEVFVMVKMEDAPPPGSGRPSLVGRAPIAQDDGEE